MENFELVRGDTPVLVHVPHASWFIPEQDSLLLTVPNRIRELEQISDTHTDIMGYFLAGDEHSLLVNDVSRIVMDPERFIIGEEMDTVGMGVRYTHGHDRARIRGDDPLERDEVINTLYTPYHAAFNAEVDRIFDTHRKALIVDVHSYPSTALPYELHGDGPRPEICIGADRTHTPRKMVKTVKSIIHGHGYTVDVNTPFAGTMVPTKHYMIEERIQSVMLEIRRDTYMDENTMEIDDQKMRVLLNTIGEIVEMLSMSMVGKLPVGAHH
jgi:N-formylglutamate deformylase